MADNKIFDSAWTLLTSFHEANEAVVKHLLAAQEHNRKLAESFFTEGMEVLKANQKAAEDLVTAQERSVQYTQRFFAEGMEVLKANQTAAHSLVAAQERNMEYVEHFFHNGIEALKSQTESMRALMQDLEQQINKQREALETLTRAPMEMTLDILYAPLVAYQKALDVAKTITQESFKQTQRMTDQMKQTAKPPDEQHGE
jgi:hypothetical protein